jgi:hypothetical protein
LKINYSISLILLFGISFFVSFAYAENYSEICQNVSDENPIVVATNNRFYEIGDSGVVYGCVSDEANFMGINIHVGTIDSVIVSGSVVPDEDGFFSKEFVLDASCDDLPCGAFWSVDVDANQEFFAYSNFIVNGPELESMFRTDIVESLIQDGKWADSKPRDISSDDKTLLLSKYQEMAIMNLDDRVIKEINVPLNLEENTNIYNLQFSKDSIDDIFFIFEGDLYKLDTRNNDAQKLIENIKDYDLTNSGKIIFSNSGSTSDDELYSVWMSDLDGTNKINLLENKKDVGTFDVSFDDSKLLFTKTTYDQPFVHNFLMIYDLNEKQFASIPELDVYCGGIPKWSPNSELIISQYGSCDRHYPEARIYTFDLDGNSHYLTESDHLTTEFLISNDGIFLYYNLAPEGVYQMTLAQPVPEFGEIVGFVLILTLLPIILLYKFSYIKSNFVENKI